MDFNTLNKVRQLRKASKIYKNKNTMNPYMLESFKSPADFTALNRCTLATDNVNFFTGANALLLTTTTAGSSGSFQKAGLNWNLTNRKDFEFRIFNTDGNFSQLFLYFMVDGANYFVSVVRNVINKGWTTLRFSKSEFTATGNPDWVNIHQMQLSIYPKAGVNTAVTLEPIYADVVEPANMVVIFDDGFETANTIGIPYLESKGVKGNCACVQNYIGTANYMTLVELQSIYARGHDILNHSQTHADLSIQTYSQVVTDIQNMRDYLLNKGMSRASDFFCYPTAWSAIAEQVIKDLGFTAGRDSAGTVNYRQGDNITRLQTCSLNPASTVNGITKWIDNIKNNGGTLFLYMHDIVDAPIGVQANKTTFQQIIDYAVAQGINFLTVSEWLKSLY